MASSTVSAGDRGTAAPRLGSLKARRPVGASARRRRIGPNSAGSALAPTSSGSEPGASRVPVSTISTQPSGAVEGPGSVSTTPMPSTVAKSVPSVARCQVISASSCQMGTTPLKGIPKRTCSGAACLPRAGAAACLPRRACRARRERRVSGPPRPPEGESGIGVPEELVLASSCFPTKYSLMTAAYGAHPAAGAALACGRR